MSYVLENEYLYLECIEAGGEIQHLINKQTQEEIMYQGDQGWGGKNPTLFPMVGNTYTGSYVIDGKTYSMKNHGLIRYATLQGKQEKDRLIFSLDANDSTLKQYPFSFHYEIQYQLIKNQVKIQYRIENTGSKDMPFGFGLHPGFQLHDTISSYFLSFDGNTNLEQLHMYETPSHWEKVETKGWQLNRQDLEKYKTMIYRGLQSQTLTLMHKDEKVLRLHVSDYPFLAIWSSSTPSDFICIEPWWSHADYDPNTTDFYHREGTKILKPNEAFCPSYTIEV